MGPSGTKLPLFIYLFVTFIQLVSFGRCDSSAGEDISAATSDINQIDHLHTETMEVEKRIDTYPVFLLGLVCYKLISLKRLNLYKT